MLFNIVRFCVIAFIALFVICLIWDTIAPKSFKEFDKKLDKSLEKPKPGVALTRTEWSRAGWGDLDIEKPTYSSSSSDDIDDRSFLEEWLDGEYDVPKEDWDYWLRNRKGVYDWYSLSEEEKWDLENEYNSL